MLRMVRSSAAVIAAAVVLGIAFLLPTPQVQAAEKDKSMKWVGQAFCGRSIRIFDGIDQMAYMIEKYTDGRLKVECKQAGEIVPAGQVFDAAGQGIIDFGHACTCMARAKSEALQWYCDAPGSQSPIEELIWYYNGGGKEILEDIFEKKYHVHPLACIQHTAEIWLFSNKKIEKVDDLVGLKVRSAGVRAEVMKKLGVSVVILPGDEIVPAMERGVIDAMEYGGLYLTYDVGFNDVTKYLYYHPKKSTSPFNIWAVNLDKWNALPDDMKKAVERASRDAVLHSLSYSIEQDFLDMKKAVELKKNIILTLPEEVTDAVDAASADYYYEKAKTDKDLARILESWAKFKKEYGPYGKWIDYINMTGDHLGLVKGDS